MFRTATWKIHSLAECATKEVNAILLKPAAIKLTLKLSLFSFLYGLSSVERKTHLVSFMENIFPKDSLLILENN